VPEWALEVALALALEMEEQVLWWRPHTCQHKPEHTL
jgi:hypothetical protein